MTLYVVAGGTEELRGLGEFSERNPGSVLLAILDRKHRKLGPEALKYGAGDYLIFQEFDYHQLQKSIAFVRERLNTREQLTNTREQFEAVFRYSRNAILLADEQGRYIDANEAAADLLGYSREELKECSVRDIVDKSLQEVDDQWRNFLHLQDEEGTIVLRKKDNSRVIAAYKAVANILPGVHLSVLTDVTEADLEYQRQNLLREVYQAGSSSEVYSHCLHRILQKLCEFMGWEAAELWWKDHSGENLFLDGGFYGGMGPELKAFIEASRSIRFSVEGAAVPARALRTGQMKLIDDLAADEDFARRPYFASASTYSGMLVPVTRENVRHGVLFLYRKFSAGSGGRDKFQLRLLSSVAEFLGNEIEKIRTRSELEKVVSSSHDLIGTLSFHKKFVRVNPAFEKTLGYSREELQEMELLEIIAEEFKPDMQRIFAKTVAGKELKMQDILTLSRSGEKKWIELSATADHSANSIYFIGRDVTHEKQIKQHLIEANRKFQLATKTASLGIWELDVVKGEVSFDEGVSAIYGMRPDETPISRSRWKQFLHPDDQQRVLGAFDKALREAQTLNLHYRIINISGEEKHVKVSAEIVYDEHGVASSMVGLSFDVTDYVRSEREKAEAARHLRERVKEQRCLYNISKLQQQDIPIDEVLQRAVEMLPAGWQHPSCTSACIQYHGRLFKTANHSSGIHRQSAERRMAGGELLEVEVCYHEEQAEGDEGAFLKEERKLIEAVADNLMATIERIRGKEQLRERETRFRNLIEHNYDVILILDADLKMVYASPSCYKLTGHTPAEVIGSRGAEHVHPEDTALRDEMIKRLLSGTAKSVSFKERIKHKLGHYLWIYATITDHRGVPGINGLVFNLKNIHEEETTRRELEVSRARLSRAQKIARLGYWRYNIPENVTFWSKEMYPIFGVEPDTEMDFEGFISLVHPDDRHYFYGDGSELHEGQRLDEVEYRVIQPSGDMVWLRGQTHVERAEDGIPLILEGAVQDITEKRVAELELVEREKRLNLFIENSPALTWLKDSSGGLISANEKFLKATGRSQADIGKPAGESNEEVAPETRLNDRKVLKARKAMKFIEKVPGEKGQMRTYEVYKFPVLSGDECMLGGFALDVTENINHLKAIEKQNRKLKEIAWTQSHVVRAPLARMIGIMNLINSDELSQDEWAYLMQSLQSSAEELDDIVSAMIKSSTAIK